MSLPVRTKLPHDLPLWVDPTKETYFITVCCLPIRRDENLREKADYILLNPVRAGLVDKPENWPFVFLPEW
jgi:hypothetical protein